MCVSCKTYTEFPKVGYPVVYPSALHLNSYSETLTQILLGPRHLARVPDYLWVAEDGMKMQGYNGSQLWDTAFSVQALVATGLGQELGGCLKLAHQYLDQSQARAELFVVEDGSWLKGSSPNRSSATLRAGNNVSTQIWKDVLSQLKQHSFY